MAFLAGKIAAAPEAPEPVKAFPDVQRPVVLVVGEQGPESVTCRVIEDRPQGAEAEDAADGECFGAGDLGAVEIGQRRLGEGGTRIDPVFFESDVVGPDVALLEDADGDAELPGYSMGDEVDGPAVSKEEEEVDLFFEEEGFQKTGPLPRGAPEKGAVPREKQPVTAVEVDLADLRPGPGQVLGKPAKKRTHRPLKQGDFFALKLSETAGDHEACSDRLRMCDIA